MCGGCGAPLTHNNQPVSDGATVAIPDLPGPSDRTPPTAGAYAAATSVNDTQPTPPTPVDLRSSAYMTAMPATPITPVSRPTTPPTYVAVGVAAPPSAPPTRAARRWGAIWARVAIILVVALIVLGALGYGSWGLFVAPSIHSPVDSELHTRFATLVNAAFKTSNTAKPITLTDAQATNALGPDDSSEWLQDVRMRFDQNIVYLTFTFEGSSGDISTHLFVENGRLKVAATTVNGYLAGDNLFAPIETGQQAEAAFNDALAQLPTGEVFQQVSVASGLLTITLA